jgi:iron complex outermembrane receptor protein
MIVLLNAFFAKAQSTGVLKGRVTNSRAEALIGATIHLLGDATNGTISDADGNYTLNIAAGTQTLVCGYIGMGADTFTVTITPNATTRQDITLIAKEGMLQTVVVTSGKFDQKLEDLTVSMEVLKPDLINNKNTTSIETALEQVPGLTIIDNDPQIRGGSGFTFGVGSRVAIVVDGIPLVSGDAGRPEWSYIPVEDIEQVEVIKGASSVLYGSSALTGVISIRTAYPRSKPRTIINYSAGEYSTPPRPAANWYGASLPAFMNLNFLHSRIIHENLDLVVGGNFNVDQGYIGPAPKMDSMPFDIKQSLHLTDSIPTFTNKDMLKIRARLNFSLRYRSKRTPGLSYGINGDGMVNKTNMVYAWLNDSAGLYRGYPGAVFLEHQTIFNLDPYIKYNPGDGISHSLVTRVFHTDNIITNNQSNSGTLYYAEYQFQRMFKKIDLNFTGGIAASLSQTHSQLYDSSGSPNNSVTNVAEFIQLDKKLWNVLNLSGGVRYEYFETNSKLPESKPVFRGGASLQVLEGTWVRTSYGQGFRYPTITERFISAKAGLFGIFPNPDLKPETSNNFEIGVKQGFKIGECMGYADVAAFNQTFHNTIEYLFGVWNPNVSIVGFKFLNTGDSRVQGIDLSIAAATPVSNKKFGVTALIGYTYVNPVSLTPNKVYAVTSALQGARPDTLSYKSSSIDTTGNVLKYRYKHMIKADVECRVHAFAVGVSYKYYSKMQNIDKAFEDIESLTQVVSKYTPEIKVINYWKTHNGFNVFDARISYKLDEKQKLSIVCNNLFNVDYMLRPLKIESPRTIAIQYFCTL